MTPVTMFWLAEVGIISWRSVKNKSRPPLPSELLATFIVFGGLTLLANGPAEKPANVVAGGLVLATMLNFFDPATGKPYGANNPKTGDATVANVVPGNPQTVKGK